MPAAHMPAASRHVATDDSPPADMQLPANGNDEPPRGINPDMSADPSTACCTRDAAKSGGLTFDMHHVGPVKRD